MVDLKGFMMTNVTMSAALAAGADAKLLLQHLPQHEDNFTKTGQKKAAHLFPAAAFLMENSSSIMPQTP
ncbi:ABC-type tungstate transport system permease subunit [Pararhizobium capsulatum DSM 1112]|uniref:ABC-type tungstate transport system permease subunit n=1 Tax=Pararhizobium capsulatum DSM 1112 TaxID=1121113 RepID=A0ABU0BZ60_9HYPH|nr:hypothetical protein [Pararhizobium capsulatum]MDQ0323550.1 ABC-type tungstate transport system permease subunit [Pararhizobium capsulatum DSM 1112]